MNRRGFLTALAIAPIAAPAAAMSVAGQRFCGLSLDRLVTSTGMGAVHMDFSNVRFSPGALTDVEMVEQVHQRVQELISAHTVASPPKDEVLGAWAPPEVRELT